MRNRPKDCHVFTERNQLRTEKRIEVYQGKKALQDTWDEAPHDLQEQHHDYLLELRRRVRQERNYVLNRGDPTANIFEHD